jgi:site-specific recombinase XerD
MKKNPAIENFKGKNELEQFLEDKENDQGCRAHTIEDMRFKLTEMLLRVDKHPKEIDIRDLKDFNRYLRKEKLVGQNKHDKDKRVGHAVNSINSYKISEKSFFRWLMENKYREDNPAADIKIQRWERKVVWLTEDEVQKHYKAAETPMEKAILKLFYNTGGRAGEIAQLDIEPNGKKSNYIDLRDRKVYFNKTKGDYKPRSIKISRDTVRAVRAYLKVRRKPNGNGDKLALFISRNGNRLSYVRFRVLFIETAIRAGIEKTVTPHTARHSFCTQLYRKTRDPFLVKRAAGHKKLSTTEIYVHIVEEDIDEEMEEIDLGF